MTHPEALLESRRRWGFKAFAILCEGRFEVGKMEFSPAEFVRISTCGVGESWEAAFADADKREAAK